MVEHPEYAVTGHGITTILQVGQSINATFYTQELLIICLVCKSVWEYDTENHTENQNNAENWEKPYA